MQRMINTAANKAIMVPTAPKGVSRGKALPKIAKLSGLRKLVMIPKKNAQNRNQGTASTLSQNSNVFFFREILPCSLYPCGSVCDAFIIAVSLSFSFG